MASDRAPIFERWQQDVNVRVESVKQSGVIQIQVRVWGVHERVAVRP